MLRVTIIYDTKSGHTHKMAQAVLAGASSVEGVAAVLKHVDEASADDILNSKGLVVGSPTHCGLMSWKLKKFFDDNASTAWGKVEGHIGAAFSTSGGLGGGNEMTLLSILNVLLNYGYLVFGLPAYAAPGVTAHYGVAAVGAPDENELKSCWMLGAKVGEFVKKVN